MDKIYLTNRGFASGSSFVLKIFDSCSTDKNGNFYFKLENINESDYYSIEFSTVKIGWIALLPRQNEHIKIFGVIRDHREIRSITGSKEYVLQEQLDSIMVPYKKLLNTYADSSSFYYEKNKDSSLYYTRLNKLYLDTLNNYRLRFAANHPKSTLSLQLLNQNIFDVRKDTIKKILLNVDNSLKNLALYKNLLEFVNTKEVLTLNGFPPGLDIVNTSGKNDQLNFNQYLKKILIIDFWASWCVPCRERIPDLKVLYNKADANKFSFISVSIDSDKQSWNKALEKENMPWDNYIINQELRFSILAKYSLNSIPRYVVINTDGKVILIGYSFEAVQGKINSLINDLNN